MTTTHRSPAVPGALLSPRPVLLALAAVAVLVAVGCITLGPTWAVADARRAVVTGVEALAAPWPGAPGSRDEARLAEVLSAADGQAVIRVGQSGPG